METMKPNENLSTPRMLSARKSAEDPGCHNTSESIEKESRKKRGKRWKLSDRRWPRCCQFDQRQEWDGEIRIQIRLKNKTAIRERMVNGKVKTNFHVAAVTTDCVIFVSLNGLVRIGRLARPVAYWSHRTRLKCIAIGGKKSANPAKGMRHYFKYQIGPFSKIQIQCQWLSGARVFRHHR